MPYHIRGGHSVLGNPKVRYDTGFRIAFLHKYMSVLLHLFITPFWVAVRGKAKLNILALVSPYSEKPKVCNVSDFNLGSFTYMNNNFVTPFYPFWGCCQG